jgi:protein SCO1
MRASNLYLALASSLCAFAPAQAHDHAHMMQMEAARPLTGASLYNLPSRWTDQDGKTVDLQSLRGEPVVLAMAYTSCKDICPLIVANMQAIEKAAAARHVKGLSFAFFSLDSRLDTPERLKTYADEHGLDARNWSLFNSDDKAVRDLAAALGVRYRADGQGGYDHSSVITLLDAQGEIVFQKLDASLDVAEFVARIESLAKSVK